MQSALRNISIMAVWSTIATIGGVILLAGVTGKPLYAPIQAISHIVFGERTYQNEKRNLLFLAVGFGLNGFAMIGWSGIAELCFRAFGTAPGNLPTAFVVAIGVTVMAYFVDFHVVPKRLTPGFEHILSTKSLLSVYTLLAVSLLLGSLGRIS
ncbi:MAG: hypothetical protein WCK51_14565 [Armatimonadota bacterium]